MSHIDRYYAAEEGFQLLLYNLGTQQAVEKWIFSQCGTQKRTSSFSPFFANTKERERLFSRPMYVNNKRRQMKVWKHKHFIWIVKWNLSHQFSYGSLKKLTLIAKPFSMITKVKWSRTKHFLLKWENGAVPFFIVFLRILKWALKIYGRVPYFVVKSAFLRWKIWLNFPFFSQNLR